MKTKIEKKTISNDPMRDRMHKLLCSLGYRCNWSSCPEEVTSQCLEHYSGPKGSVIMQVYDGHNGVNLYADWAIGHTWEETEAALKA